MRIAKGWRSVVLVTGGLLVGYFIGPPLVQAASTQIVTIQGWRSTNRAIVNTLHQLSVNTEGSNVTVGRQTWISTASNELPTGENLLASGTASGSINCTGVQGMFISAAIADGTGTVRLNDQASNVLWRGTVSGDHIGDTFVNELFVTGPVTINVTGGSPQYEIYGTLIGCTALGSKAERTRSHLRSSLRA